MSHAFRLQSIQRHGMTSWDNIWSNGMNYWRSYQYLPHFAVLGLAKLFTLSIPQAMIWTVVIVFVLLRLETYVLLRQLKVAPVYAFFTTVISFAFIQQWVAIEDFSIFIVLPILPIFLYFWIRTMQESPLTPVLSAMAGIMWLCHPVLGYTATGLLGCAMLFSTKKLSWKGWVVNMVVFLASFAAFLVPYVMYGYSYANPIFSLSQFLKQVVVNDSFGLSYIYTIGIVLSWLTILIDPEHFKRWSKILLLYCTLYIAAVSAGVAGYLPNFINQLQISRGIVMIGFILPFIFGVMVQTIAPKLDQRFRLGLLAVFTALILTEAIIYSGQYGPQPANGLENPVSNFFKDKPAPTGSVLTDNVSEASYFTEDKLRFPQSYNEQLEPQPLAQRLRRLIKTDVSYSSISHSQIEEINDYVQFMGVEYVFMPKYSPTVSQLLNQGDKKYFDLAGEIQTTFESFDVLRTTAPVHSAYLADTAELKKAVSFTMLPKPGVRVEEFLPWDAEVKKEVTFLNQKSVLPLNLKFDATDRLSISIPADKDSNGKMILVTQSYDPYWKTFIDGRAMSNVTIEPTALRFIALTLPSGLNGKTLTLQHFWPEWYWPVQAVSGSAFGLVILWWLANSALGRLRPPKENEDVVAGPLSFIKPKRLSIFTPAVKKTAGANVEETI